mmetsp:Transcript_9190/g.15293  ORF Transcript_9190/g.15293 Transcript_9190/m.15293 type:complete len:98 (+) Transcript_9190:1468-1761(+)
MHVLANRFTEGLCERLDLYHLFSRLAARAGVELQNPEEGRPTLLFSSLAAGVILSRRGLRAFANATKAQQQIQQVDISAALVADFFPSIITRHTSLR